MKIKNVSCMQFAGIRECDISFSDGINVIYGKNESGKSTLVNLISRTLFQNARVDGRKDKEFRQMYFPGEKRGSLVTGDSIDGKISFDTPNGTYTLIKEWGADARNVLTAPQGVFKDAKTIDSILREVLGYGEGVYNDMLFSSQKNSDAALQTVLDAAKKTDAKQEIADSITCAFAQSDGLSADTIQEAINSKIEEIGGKHWDFERGLPLRKNGRWASGLGEILKAYYAMEDAQAELDAIIETEEKLEEAVKKYNECVKTVESAERKFNEFNVYSSMIEGRNERKKSVERIEKELSKISKVLGNWPKILNELEKAKMLRDEKINRELLDKYNFAKTISEELNKFDMILLKGECPSDDEILQVRNWQRNVGKLENKLCGMNLTAMYKTFGSYNAEIVSLRTGEVINVENGNAAISEAVRISIPEVLEMTLSPTDVNVDAVKCELEEFKTKIAGVLGKYGVKTIEELETLKDKIKSEQLRFKDNTNRLKMSLGEVSFEELESKAGKLSGVVRDKDDIERDIMLLCKTSDLERFITVKETEIIAYSKEYISIAELNAGAYALEDELKKAKEKIESPESVPVEYLGISDPNGYLELLGMELKEAREQCEKSTELKSELVGKLETYKEDSCEAPDEKVKETRRKFEETHTLLKHWVHIGEVLSLQREAMHEAPMQDIADSFTQYLGLISDNKISSVFPDGNKLNMDIYSDDRLIDYGKLSEGSKETVSLAFRLAVLDHLFPDGGGVIVLDDPLTDMDAERVEYACKLICECGKKHQVIFLTCREEYIDKLKGNCIRV